MVNHCAKNVPEGWKTSGVLLTVAVCTIPSRMTSFVALAEELVKQAQGKPVEVLGFFDNMQANLSEKRNLAVAAAKGAFFAFVDDDDRVEPDYVDSILREIRKAPDVDCIVFDVMVHGYTAEPKLCTYDAGFDHGEDAERYYRKPNHLMAYRTEIARRHGFRSELARISEDTEWAERACRDIERQARIGKVLYHYRFDASRTTQMRPAPPASGRTLADVSFIVLEAAPHERTTKCLRSIRKFAAGAEVILVANGSQPLADGLAAADQVVSLDANLGFAAGCNAGAEASTREILCFMNNDAAFADDTPARLIGALTPEFSIVGPYSNRAKPPQGDIERASMPSWDCYPATIVGLCMMVPRALHRTLGGFDPRLLTYEDDDFCSRAFVQAGARCKVVGGTWVEHERHATFRALGLDVDRVMAENWEVYRKKYPRIRVIAIAKDEETSLPGFFLQFAAVTRDWCVLDTGSTDRTIEIARRLGARVETAPFVDFAAARNEALARFGGGADWIVMFDPDERLDRRTIACLHELVFRTDHDVFLSPLEAEYANGGRRRFVPKVFMFRNRPEIRWAFKVHEKLLGSTRQALVTNALISHRIALHADERRRRAAVLYDGLMRAEPYFTDPAYRARMIDEWPVLDADRTDDPRLAKIHVGPLVSVVIPTYRRSALLERAVSSALAQDYETLEVVVVGDGCPELGEFMRANRNPRVRVFNLRRNHGPGGAVPRNHGIAAAAGRLIAYLDDDNAWKPDHVSSLCEALREHAAAFAFSSMEVDGVDIGFTAPGPQGIDTSCVIHDKELIARYGGWSDLADGTYLHDWELVSRWVRGGERWACTRRPTVDYNEDTSGQREYLRRRIGRST